MINRHFKTFFEGFARQGGNNDSFMNEIDVDVLNLFTMHQREIWDMEKTFDIAIIRDLLENMEDVDLSNFNISIHDDLLLIFNNKFALKFYSTGVLVPEIIGTRSEWFENLNYEFIDIRPMLAMDIEVAEGYITTKDGVICPNSITEIFAFIIADEPEKAIALTLKECLQNG